MLLETFDKWQKILADKQLELESLVMSARYSYQARVRIPRDAQILQTEQALLELFEQKRQPMPVLDWRRIGPFYLNLELGKENVEQRLSRFLAAYPDAFDDQLLKVGKIDLRYPNGFAVQWNENDIPQELLQLAITVDEKG